MKATPPSLAPKKLPEQRRGARTYECILEVAARTLADVGIERLSTNLVCERAGLSPPALYRYFPNKYALLGELAKRLMRAQNECVGRWMSLDVYRGPVEGLERALEGLLLDTYAVTAQATGGMWIMRALHAVPALREVRLASHAAVTQVQADLMHESFPGARQAELRLVSRIVVDLMYAAVEMLCEQPMDAKAVARLTASMLASHRRRLGPAGATVSAPSARGGRRRAGAPR